MAHSVLYLPVTEANMRNLVTKDGWGVSCTSGVGIDGLILNVYRFHDLRSPSEKCSECDGRKFPVSHLVEQGTPYMEAMDQVRDEADRVALAHGHLQVYHRDLVA